MLQKRIILASGAGSSQAGVLQNQSARVKMLCSKRVQCAPPAGAHPAVQRKTTFSASVAPSLLSTRGACQARAPIVWAAEAAPLSAAQTSDMRKYETLIVLKPTLTDEERDQELARFESFLLSVRCKQPFRGCRM